MYIWNLYNILDRSVILVSHVDAVEDIRLRPSQTDTSKKPTSWSTETPALCFLRSEAKVRGLRKSVGGWLSRISDWCSKESLETPRKWFTKGPWRPGHAGYSQWLKTPSCVITPLLPPGSRAWEAEGGFLPAHPGLSWELRSEGWGGGKCWLTFEGTF